PQSRNKAEPLWGVLRHGFLPVPCGPSAYRTRRPPGTVQLRVAVGPEAVVRVSGRPRREHRRKPLPANAMRRDPWLALFGWPPGRVLEPCPRPKVNTGRMLRSRPRTQGSKRSLFPFEQSVCRSCNRRTGGGITAGSSAPETPPRLFAATIPEL